MSNLINPLSPGLSLPLSENLSTLQITEIPPELADQLKPGMTVQLKIQPPENGMSKAVLQLEGKFFNILLQTESLNMTLPEDGLLSVRIAAGGQLIPVKNETAAVSSSVGRLPAENILPQVDVRPINPEGFVDDFFRTMQVPTTVKQQVMNILRPFEVSLAALEGDGSNAAVLRPLQEVLQKIAADPQSFPQLREQLEQTVEALSGRQISGEVTGRINDMTRISTPLGETFFVSKIKLPPAATLLLNINGTVPAFDREVKFLDDLLKVILPGKDLSVKPSMLEALPQLKSLAIVGSLSAEALSAVVNRLPVNGDNLLGNIYHFYRAAVQKDVAGWLKTDMARLESLDPLVRGRVMEELNSFVAAAAKETPSWRMVEMPLFDGNQFKPLKIAVKKDSEQDQKQSGHKQNGTRFVVETDFSKLGGFQFDGFVSRSKRSLDLIIRTTKALEDDFCSNVINLFKKSLYDLDYVGTIKINRQENFIVLQEENSLTGGIYV